MYGTSTLKGYTWIAKLQNFKYCASFFSAHVFYVFLLVTFRCLSNIIRLYFIQMQNCYQQWLWQVCGRTFNICGFYVLPLNVWCSLKDHTHLNKSSKAGFSKYVWRLTPGVKGSKSDTNEWHLEELRCTNMKCSIKDFILSCGFGHIYLRNF